MGSWLGQRKALLLDLDNTVYDWISFFAPAFRGMCRTLVEMTGLPLAVVFDQFKSVFAMHGTVEYSFALQELPCLRALHPRESSAELVERYRPVIDVFQHRRRAYLRPYPGVREGIAILHEAGYIVVGVTDSRQFQAENRLRQLRLDRIMDGLCCISNHLSPDSMTVAAIRRKPDHYYKSELSNVLPMPSGLRKPSPEVLSLVASWLQIKCEACLYVGDSLTKDVGMAQYTNVYDCWAEYGTKVSALDLATLIRITDWSQQAVQDTLNQSPSRLGIFPSYSAKSFDEVVALALMEPRERPRKRRLERMPEQKSLFEIGPVLVEG